MKAQASLLLRRGLTGMLILLLLAAGWPTSQASAASASSIAAGRGPHAVAVNSATNRVYIANADSDSVTVLEDTGGGGVVAVANVATGTTPYAVAVNSLTNRIYVANADSDTVTVIDGATNSTIEVETGSLPMAIAVNPATNKIYVANLGSDTVTVIDGAAPGTNTLTVQVGESPFALAINEAANKIYVANVDDDTLTIIDGATNSVSAISTGAGPNALAVNPLTGSVYVADFYSNTVTVTDGTTRSTLNVGVTPTAVEVNPATGIIYVANTSSNSVTVIDGATHSLSTVAVGAGPAALAVNAQTNQIYVANYHSNDVTVIDGASLTTSTIAAGRNPIAVAVNAERSSVYVANFNSDEVTVISEEQRAAAAELGALSVSAGNLSPAFDPGVHSYTVHVGLEVEQIIVTADTYDTTASLSVNAQVYGNHAEIPVSLQPGANVLPIVVHAADGLTSRSYTVTIYRSDDAAAESNADLSGLSVSRGVLQPSFDPDILTYFVEVGHAVSSIQVTAAVYGPATSLLLNGQPYSGGVSSSIGLHTGVNPVILVTTAQDGLTSKIYTVNVRRAQAPITDNPSPTPGTSTPGQTGEVKPELKDVIETASGATLTDQAATLQTAEGPGGQAEATAMLHTDALTKALGMLQGKTAGSQTITFELSGAEAIRKVGIPAAWLVAAAGENRNAVMEIKTANGSYTLPLNFPTLTAQLKQLGGKLDNAGVFLTMETIAGAAKDRIAKQTEAAGMTLIGDIMDFTLRIETNGSSQVFTDFGRTYVSRSILAAGNALHSAQTTAVRFNPQTGAFSFVPSTFTLGGAEMNIFHPGNGLYAIVQSKQSFADLQGHWAQADVELLASKHIVNGRTLTDFAPEGKVTRAEFASLIVRALGLEVDSASVGHTFADIADTDWFAGAVRTAVKAQIVTGFGDETFRPNDTITREQMAVMLSRALAFVDKPIAVTGELLPLTAGFRDQAAISPWAQVAVAQMVKSGVITGINSKRFAPHDLATRAQAAVVIKRVLQTAGFIN